MMIMMIKLSSFSFFSTFMNMRTNLVIYSKRRAWVLIVLFHVFKFSTEPFQIEGVNGGGGGSSARVLLLPTNCTGCSAQL